MGTRHWTQSYADIPAEIDADRYASMVDLLDAALERHASRPAFKAFGQTLNYADVDRLSRSFASYLQNKLGVRQGDRVAVMMPNLLAFPVTLLGIMRAGAVQVNVNPLYTPRELEHQLNDAGVETIVVFSGSTPTLAEVRANTGLKTVITVGVGDASGATLPSPPVDALLGESVSFAEALAQGGGLPLQPVALTGDDLLFLQYTGGTTGLSKGAALSHRNLVANTEQFKAFMPVAVKEGEEVLVTAIPLYHIFALMVSLSYAPRPSTPRPWMEAMHVWCSRRRCRTRAPRSSSAPRSPSSTARNSRRPRSSSAADAASVRRRSSAKC